MLPASGLVSRLLVFGLECSATMRLVDAISAAPRTCAADPRRLVGCQGNTDLQCWIRPHLLGAAVCAGHHGCVAILTMEARKHNAANIDVPNVTVLLCKLHIELQWQCGTPRNRHTSCEQVRDWQEVWLENYFIMLGLNVEVGCPHMFRRHVLPKVLLAVLGSPVPAVL